MDSKDLLSQPIFGFDFQHLIGDVEDFLEFSENNIEWQYRRELQDIRRKQERREVSLEYADHLVENAEHRFMVSLPLRVRYAAVIALCTTVEWQVEFIADALKEPLSKGPNGTNKTVHALVSLCNRAAVECAGTVKDYTDIVWVRNCIVHAAGVIADYEYSDGVETSVDRLSGFSLDNLHFIGRHICIEKGALNPYIRNVGDLVISLYRAAHEKGLLRTGS